MITVERDNCQVDAVENNNDTKKVSKAYSLGCRLVSWVGLKDLKESVDSLSQRKYTDASLHLAKGSCRLVVTAIACCCVYKIAVAAWVRLPWRSPTLQEVNEEVLPGPDPEITPVEDAQLDIGTCEEAKILEKWRITCDEYAQDEKLQDFIKYPEVYRCKDNFGHELARNAKGDLLIPMAEGKYEKWEKLRDSVDHLVCHQHGFGQKGTPMLKLEEGQRSPARYNLYTCQVIKNGESHWSVTAKPYPHGWMRFVNGTSGEVHSCGLYPEERLSVWNLAWNLRTPFKGMVASGDPMEFHQPNDLKMFTHIISEGQYKEGLARCYGEAPTYVANNAPSKGMNCFGFVDSVLRNLGINPAQPTPMTTKASEILIAQQPQYRPQS